jgi:23S rRNA (adenine2503-C2)-methyltransferase
MKDRGQSAYRVGQVRKWLFAQRAESFTQMTDLPQALREELAASFTLWNSSIARHTQADDGTEKLLLTLADGGQVECVLLRDETRRTICISTQVGCGMGCVFCASGLEGLARNLTTGEIVEQMLRLQTLLQFVFLCVVWSARLGVNFAYAGVYRETLFELNPQCIP